MLRRFFTIGITCSLLLLPVHALGGKPLYERMKELSEKEAPDKTVDEALVPYLHAVFEKEWKISENDVRSMLKGETSKACTDGSDDKKTSNTLSCETLARRMRQLAEDEGRIRLLGRALQITASSYELPISDLPGRTVKLSADLRAILNIWSAGTGSVKSSVNTPLIRTFVGEEDPFKPLLTDVGESLETLKYDEKIAAIWRYQYGVRLVNGGRAPRFPAPVIGQQSGPGTERQYLSKRWTPLEEALMAIWDEIKDDTFNPPLSRNETVYYTFSAELLESSLPDNVIVWARIDGDKAGNFPFGDVGLHWEVPVEPVMPALVKENSTGAILGGNYPPAPVESGSSSSSSSASSGSSQPTMPIDGTGLCSNPVNERGYLCRPYTAVAPEERCPLPAGSNPNEIHLVFCTASAAETAKQARTTAAGADVCREIGWREKTPFDPATQCTLALRCAATCPAGNDPSGTTGLKDANGVIPVCIQGAQSNPSYTLYHELVHAYQLCGKPPATNPYAGANVEARTAACCQLEGEAYRAECAMMERDGVFTNPDGTQKTSGDGIPFNAETCAEALANVSCSKEQGAKGCFVSRPYSQSFVSELNNARVNNPKKLPATCNAAIDPATMDLRIRQLKDAIELRDDVCRPGETLQYKNRIGNNACYIGQCVEMSLELHRIAGGQTPATVQDEIAPWESPNAGTPLGNVLMNPPLAQSGLPVYRPELLMRELETALCQLQGLPPRTPPILCAVSAGRQLELTRQTGTDVTAGISDQNAEFTLNTDDLLNLAQAIGTRAGTQMYGEYMRESNRSFAGILGMANELLEELQKIDFPTEMCPAGTGLPSASN